MSADYQSRVSGVLLGSLVGDALGLPAEGLRPAMIRRLGWKGNWKHRFVFGCGMGSDDTEHTIMLSQSLLAAEGDVDKFTRFFASELRWWLLGLPAGVGMATARSIVRLWAGSSPTRSGVFSAGNGPCMRTAIIGVMFLNDRETRRVFTEAHTRITHSDPKAMVAAEALTELAALLADAGEVPDSEVILKVIHPGASDAEWDRVLTELRRCWSEGLELSEFLSSIGADPSKGISGYAYHTVPAAVFSGVRYDWRFEETLSSILDAGGDADTAGAIAGALCGAFGGVESIPRQWLNGICEWPVSTRRMERLATALVQAHPMRIRARWSPALLLRNLFFLVVVIFHGIARLGRVFLPNRTS